jgi:cytochrome c-type biogenesis protein CcmH/NrfG
LISRQERRELANYYTFGYPQYDRAEEILKELIREDPGDTRVQSELFFLYRQSGQYDRAIEFLEDWLQRNPGDPNALKELKELRKIVGQSAGDTLSYTE